ncbi:hypothetical protein TWF694_001552 [Orbilia ellipsospora]|uniref:Uncharacterized protein n=1 Tax=Orbilia ellipsospora TaxID=2528407 RepID=A0AAV9XTI0_9PEZI
MKPKKLPTSQYLVPLFLSLIFLPLGVAQNDCGDLTDTAAQSVATTCVQAADVTLSESSTVSSVNLANLRNIKGDLNLQGSNLQSFQAANLESVTGDFTLISSKLSQLSIPKLSNITGDVYFNFSISPLTTITLDLAAVSIDTDFACIDCLNIQRINIGVTPTSPKGNRTLELYQLNALNTLSITGVEFATVNISAASISSLPNIWAENSNLIKLFSLPALGNVTVSTKSVGNVAIAGVTSPVFNFAALSTVTDTFDFIQTDTSTLLLPELLTVTNGVTISLNEKLPSFSIPKIETISDLAIANNSILTDVSFAALKTVGTIAIEYNDNMARIDLATWFPSLSQVTSYIAVIGTFNNITLPNLQSGNGVRAPSITIISSVELDCDIVRNEIISKQAVQDISNFQCTSGPKGTKPSATTNPSSPASTSPSTTDVGKTGDNGSGSVGSHKNVGAIAGGVVGGVVVLVALAALVLFFLKRREPTPPGETTGQTKVGGIESHVGGIEDSGRNIGGVASTGT